MKLALARISILVVQVKHYLPIGIMVFTLAAFAVGFNPGDLDGGVGK